VTSIVPHVGKEQVTVTFDSDTLTTVRRKIGDGSLSAWLDAVVRERLLRDDFEAHAASLRASGWPSPTEVEDLQAHLMRVQGLSDAAG
jgi:hypothetical protein